MFHQVNIKEIKLIAELNIKLSFNSNNDSDKNNFNNGGNNDPLVNEFELKRS